MSDLSTHVLIGIDPGYDACGFAVIHGTPGNIKIKEFGIIKTCRTERIESRLHELRCGLLEILRIHCIREAAVEELFFNLNKKTAVKVAQARGVILELLFEQKITVCEYAPSTVKKALTGSGSAKKVHVQKSAAILTGLKTIPRQDDAADALAVGITHLFYLQQNQQIKTHRKK